MQLCTITSLPSGMNDTKYSIYELIENLESIVEPEKVSSSIEHQSAEIYPWKSENPMNAQR